MVDGQTSPPNLLTEADLISLMDKHGIGKLVITMKTKVVFSLHGQNFEVLYSKYNL